MTENVSFVSLNVQGLGDKLKRKDVFNYLRSKKYNIYFLQDTHFTDKDMKINGGLSGFFSAILTVSQEAKP